MSESSKDDSLERYARQLRYAPLGTEGQRKLMSGHAVVVGCGALGSLIAEWLVRAGVGIVTIIDRDFVELNNLPRQVLFDEQDAANAIPKAVAAAEKLRRINSQVQIEAIIADVTADNVLELVRDAQVIVDGLDSFETRLLVNDAAARLQIPWIYGGCIGAEGQSMTILPGEPPCLRCLVPVPPPPGSTPTCDTAGVLGAAVGVVASLEAAEAIKILSGNTAAVRRGLVAFDIWSNQHRQIKLAALRERGGCATCRREEFPWLDGHGAAQSVSLCGRNAVQIRGAGASVDLNSLQRRWRDLGTVAGNKYLARLVLPQHTLTVFADGRAVISGTDDAAVARSLYAKYVGV